MAYMRKSHQMLCGSLYHYCKFQRHVVIPNCIPLSTEYCSHLWLKGTIIWTHKNRLQFFSSSIICMKWSHRDLVTLDESDLEEHFTRGSGPGGQSVNKSSNCVFLRHVPSGTVLQCHESRSLHENRRIARRRMQEKLDVLEYGENSVIVKEKAKAAGKKYQKKSRTRHKLELIKRLKELEEN